MTKIIICCRSAITEIFELLKIHEEADEVAIRMWPRLRVGHIPETVMNPNLYLDFRNQAAAHTDCLFLYKVREYFDQVSRKRPSS